MAASFSSSSFSSVSMVRVLSPKVFVNFRGAELRDNFISHLEEALLVSGINYFIDTQLVPSEPILSIFKHIEDSEVALAIFSERYTESKWCLNELVKIMERVAEDKLKVIPIFFKVEVLDVKHQTGDFGRNLYRGGHCEDSMCQWEKALKSVTGILGLNSVNYRTQRDFIADIVREVKIMLPKISPISQGGEGTNMLSTTIDLPRRDLLQYGIVQRLNQVEEKFFQFKWAYCQMAGTPRTGNTTLAETYFTKWNQEFTFKKNIQSIREKNTVLNAQYLNDEAKMSTTKMDGMSFVSHRGPRVFINFRGEQIRNSFISHLIKALRDNIANVLIDIQEITCKDTIHDLFKSMEKSSIAIVVFSITYTQSTWALREAEKIKELVLDGTLMVIPVFYKVSPTNVRLLNGEFGDNFRDQERCNDKPLIEKWKEALAFIGNIMGFHLAENGDEAALVASIVKEVSRTLAEISLATQTAESHVNQFLYREETSENAFGGILSNELSNHCYSSTAQSDMYTNRFADLFNVGPNQSNYTTDNSIPCQSRKITTRSSIHYQPTNRSWGEFSNENSDDDSGHREPYIPAKQLNVSKSKKKMD